MTPLALLQAWIVVRAEQSELWQVATDLVLFAFVLVILACAVAFVQALLMPHRPEETDVATHDVAASDLVSPAPSQRASLDAAVRCGQPVSRVHSLSGPLAGLDRRPTAPFASPATKGFRK